MARPSTDRRGTGPKARLSVEAAALSPATVTVSPSTPTTRLTIVLAG